MIMGIVLSASNMKLFRQCPRKFQAKYITKEIPYTQSPQAARGEMIHALMERAVLEGWDSVEWPAEEATCRETAKGFVEAVHKFKANGWTVRTEYEAATDGMGNTVDWFDKYPRNWMRSRLDVYLSNSAADYGMIIDWKTGKPWDDDLQLKVNALCMEPITGLKKYKVLFAYIDQNLCKSWDVEVDVEQPRAVQCKDTANMYEVVALAQDIEGAIAGNRFPATENRFCAWCELTSCKYKK